MIRRFSEAFNVNQPPTPPPPPVLSHIPPISQHRAIKQTINPINKNYPSTSCDEETVDLLKTFIKQENILDDQIVISKNCKVAPIIQDGPMCGLVALAMAGSKMCLDKTFTIADLLTYSQNSNFSKQGEMFSAYALANVAAHCLNIDYDIVDISHDHTTNKMLDNLLNGNLILIPYDADKNHMPCLKKGHTAHWGVITGFVCNVINNNALNDIIPDDILPNVFHLRNILASQIILPQILQNNIHFYVRQGKSKHLALWSMKSLLASNMNLKEVDPDKHFDDELWNLPVNGLEHILGHKAIILKN